MIRKMLAVCCGPLLLAACARVVATPAADASDPSDFVDAVRDYAKPQDIPASFQHLVDWHVGIQPVVLLLAAGGRRACAVTPMEASRVIIGQPYRCRWSGAR